MTFLRATLFNIVFYLLIATSGFVSIPLIIMPRRYSVAFVRGWTSVFMAALRSIVGLKFRVIGTENMPRGPAIIAAKHQSAWDTFVFLHLHQDAAYVMKQELFSLPFYGWYAGKLEMIGVDREGGGAALKAMTAAAARALKAGRPLIIFPQGTRTPTGSGKPYLPGTYSIYRAAGVPVVPVALNSGSFWGRNAYMKYPGTITVEYLPAIPPGIDRKTFMARLEATIETASERLLDHKND